LEVFVLENFGNSTASIVDFGAQLANETQGFFLLKNSALGWQECKYFLLMLRLECLSSGAEGTASLSAMSEVIGSGVGREQAPQAGATITIGGRVRG
jgi:hypothetical protein